MDQYQYMEKLYTFLALLCGVLALVFGYLASNYKEKSQKNNPVINIDNTTNKTYNVKYNKGIIGDGNIINPSIQEQRIEKIALSLKNLHSDNLREFELSLNYLKENPEFSDNQIKEIFQILNAKKFNNVYQEEVSSLLSHRESSTATSYFGELIKVQMYTPSPSIQYFSKNNVDFKIFEKYLKNGINQYREPNYILSVISSNSSFNRDYILKFLNSKELINLIFDDLHPNYIQNVKLNLPNNTVHDYIAKKDFETSYFYSRFLRL